MSAIPPEPLTAGPGIIRSSLLRVAEPARAPGAGLLGDLLREQQTMTAVERFSRVHDEGTPAQARYYKDLVPFDRPAAGQQYAFEVDLDACTGCKACVAACHSLNGLDEAEMWRSVGLLHGGTVEAPAQQTVTTACHHCVDPACLSGCPVQAYEKDPVTGIVKHLDDQCIGCQYCTLMCPYDAPKYSAQHGIVRKCDMCSGRLAVSEAPACVQGCPNEAIAIRIVERQSALEAGQAERFLPGAPTPAHTVPTTIYKSARPTPAALLPADFYSVSPEQPHLPLGMLLVLTQLAAGTFILGLAAQWLVGMPTTGPAALAVAALALTVGLTGLGASVFHLGRPLGAWRALLGLRTSWMSREALAFGLFAKLGALQTLALGTYLLPAFPGSEWLASQAGPLALATAAVGLVGVLSSVMIYVATRRAQWRLPGVAAKFLGSSVLLGAVTLLLVTEALDGWLPQSVAGSWRLALRAALLVFLPLATAAKLLFELSQLRHLRHRDHTVGKRVAILMVRDLGRVTGFRLLCGTAGGIAIPLFAWRADHIGLLAAALAFCLLLTGELLERYLFFTTAPPSRMPGGLA